MDLAQIGTEHPELKGTFLGELFTVLQAGDFTEIKHDPESGEEVAGTMTDMEKTLFTVVDMYCEREKALILRLDGRGKPYSSDELPGLRRDLSTTRLRYSTSREMLWNCIRERMQDHDQVNSTSLGIRSDFQIVHIFKSDRPSVLSFLLG